MTEYCPKCNSVIETEGDRLILSCPACRGEVKARKYVQLAPLKLEGTPLKGNVRIAWFGVGGLALLLEIIWFAVNGGGDASALAATILLSLCGIFIPIYLAQRKTRTFEEAVQKGVKWMGWLAWFGLISVAAIQFSIPLLFVMLGIIAIGCMFFLLTLFFAWKSRNRQSRVPEIANHTPLPRTKTQQ